LLRGSGVFPVRGWRIGLASTDSALRRRAGSCHDRVSGTGLLSHVIERGLTACSCRKRERARGLGDRAVVTAAAAAGPGRWVGCRQAGARRGSAACGGSRWWRSSFPGAWRSRCKRWRIRRPPGGLRGLVHHPPQVRRALLGDVGVGPAGQLTRAGEAADVADLGQHHQRGELPDAGQRGQHLHPLVGLGACTRSGMTGNWPAAGAGDFSARV
jgi:hypothetical protein